GRLWLHDRWFHAWRGLLRGAGDLPAGRHRHGHFVVGERAAAGNHVVPRLRAPPRHAEVVSHGRAGEFRLSPVEYALALPRALAVVFTAQAPLGRDAPQRELGAVSRLELEAGSV